MRLYVLPRVVPPERGAKLDSKSSARLADTLPDNALLDAQELEDTQPIVRLPGAYEEFSEAPTAPGVMLGENAAPGTDLSLNELIAQHDSTFERVLRVVSERVKRLFPAHFSAAHPRPSPPRGDP